jgi:hypothetical protein
MADEVDVLLKMWQEQRDQARQQENQRSTMTNLVLVVAAAGFGFLAKYGIRDAKMLLVTGPLTVLGAYGAISCAKFYERYHLHIAGALALKNRLDETYPQLRLEADRSAAHAEHQRKHPVLWRVRLNKLWIGLHGGIAAVGAILSILVIFNPS